MIASHWIRRAQVTDLPGILQLENLFPGDKISRSSFLHLLRHGHADLWIAETISGLIGNTIVFYRRNSTTARLYSIVVAPEAQGQGIGRGLLETSAIAAYAYGRMRMVLEVRKDNNRAHNFYHQAGYRDIKLIPNYYHDGMAALRMSKAITAAPDPKIILADEIIRH